MQCIPSIKLRNESDGIAIERLRCVNQSAYNWEYSLVKFNCGTYCRSTLGMADIANPSLTNFGVGDGLQYTPRGLEQLQEKTHQYCADKIAIIRNILFALERMKPLTEEEKIFLATYEQSTLKDEVKFGPDVIVQMILSVARDSASGNREFLKNVVVLGSRLDAYRSTESKKLHRNVRSFLRPLGKTLRADPQARGWLRENYPELSELLDLAR